MQLLKFGKGNAKLDGLAKLTGRPVYTFSLLSGYSCPFADKCLSKAVKVTVNGKLTRKIKDGPNTEHRCFSASQEAFYPPLYNHRKYNFDLLRKCYSVVEMRNLILASLPKTKNVIYRWHVGGDFFNRNYMIAFVETAILVPNCTFYAYTKSLPWLVELKQRIDKIPNLLFTASYGGTTDILIETEKLRYAKVVFSESEAKSEGLPIDHDDRYAALPKYKNTNFALLLHGTQPANTPASYALRQLGGKGSYSRTRKD